MSFSEDYATNHPTRDEIDGIRAPTVLEFGQPSCPCCQASEPVIRSAFKDFPGVSHLKLEDGQGRLLGRSFEVHKWPTLIFLQEGEEVDRLVRPASEKEVRKALESIDTKSYRDPDQAGTGHSDEVRD